MQDFMKQQSRSRLAGKKIIAVAVFFIFYFAIGTVSSAHAAVVINEVFPKTDDATKEWIELYNTGSDPVSMDRWTLQNTNVPTQTFMMNASSIIQSNGFLTFMQSQTGISLNVNGDTVRLSDEKNNLMDSQTYPGTLGFNTSMGRSPDGGNSWTICNSVTYNQKNDCPIATPTLTPTPSDTPTPMPTATPTPPPTPIPTPTTVEDQNSSGIPVFVPPAPNAVLGATAKDSPTPTPSDQLTLKVSKTLTIQIAVILAAWGVIALAAFLQNKLRHRTHK